MAVVAVFQGPELSDEDMEKVADDAGATSMTTSTTTQSPISRRHLGDNMSAEAARALSERLRSDEKFRAQFVAQLAAAETPDDKRRVLTDAGYDVSLGELPTLQKLAGMSELSDEELENLAGGVGDLLDRDRDRDRNR
ncbi:MAG TPA: Nif11-like leader peptide family RiPP precursor [Chloroflexota bacterium]